MSRNRRLVRVSPGTLAQMIKAGRYDWNNAEINDTNFPSIDPSRFTTRGVELLHFHFGREIPTKDILTELDRKGYRPATIEQLLAYGAENPDEQRTCDIVALGSSRLNPGDDDLVVPVLGVDDGDRELYLRSVDPAGAWFDHCRVLAARKPGT